MKKFICFIIIGVILISSIPSYAEPTIFNDGPMPEKQYYINFTITHNNVLTSTTFDTIVDEYWIYSDIQDVLGVPNINTEKVLEYELMKIGTNPQLIQYKNGEIVSTTTPNVYPLSSTWGTKRYDLPTFLSLINSGIVTDTKTAFQMTLNYELIINLNTLNIVDSNGVTQIYAQAPPIPQYEDGSTLLINSGNASGNNPLATITVKYRLDQRTIGNLSDWSFKLESSPNRYMKVIKHTPLDYLYPQPSLYRYGEIIYQGLSIEGNNTFKAIASNPVIGHVLNSNLWVYDYYPGFIDVNEDGQDDRYNSGDDSQGPIPNEDNLLVNSGALPVRSDYEDGILGTIAYFMDLIFTYISTPFTWISTSLQTMVNWLTESMSWVTSLNLFFGAIFGFLPEEFRTTLLMLLLVTVIFSILTLLRGK